MATPSNDQPAACPLPDGSLCGTCPDCQADAINDARWPDGGEPVVIPEQAAATITRWRLLWLVLRETFAHRGTSIIYPDGTVKRV